MAVTDDIIATYRGPSRMVRALLQREKREDRLFILLIAGCVMLFVIFAPREARQAHLDDTVPLAARLYWSAFFWVMIMPFVFYLLAALTRVVSLPFIKELNWYGARMALFWAVLASAPVGLLFGLVAGMIGPGMQQKIAGILWVGIFLWFWVAGLTAAGEGET